MKQTNCPYCDHTVEKPSPDTFMACTQCGYRFARVDARGEGYLVIDSKLPDLMVKYEEIRQREGDSVIVIDRRVSHNHIAGADRRR